MSKPGYLNLRLSDRDRGSIRVIAGALGVDATQRGFHSRVIHEALHFYAGKLVGPCCPDCGTDLVPVLNDGEPSGRWYCPGCVQ